MVVVAVVVVVVAVVVVAQDLCTVYLVYMFTVHPKFLQIHGYHGALKSGEPNQAIKLVCVLSLGAK